MMFRQSAALILYLVHLTMCTDRGSGGELAFACVLTYWQVAVCSDLPTD